MSDYPSIRPSLNLEFARTKKLDPRVTFRRASTGTYVDSDGLIKTAGIDVPRFDHDPVTGVCKGLLVEEQRTNDFTTFTLFSGCTATANAATAPDGSYTATRVDSNSNAFFRYSYNIVAGTSYTVSLYVKSIYSAAKYFRLQFNTAGSTGVISGLKDTPISSDSWTRCVLTGTATVTGTIRIEFGANFTFNSGDSILIWGTQVEAGAFPTSYIPTAGATVTRSADLASITGTNFSSWYNQSEGTVFADLAIGVVSGHGFAISDGTVSNRIILDAQSTSKRFIVTNAGTSQAIISKTYTITSRTKSAAAYSTNNFQFCDQGSLGIFDNAGSVPVLLSRLYIGASATGTTLLANGAISRIAYWPKRLPDAQLQALTRR